MSLRNTDVYEWVRNRISLNGLELSNTLSHLPIGMSLFSCVHTYNVERLSKSLILESAVQGQYKRGNVALSVYCMATL